MKKNYNIVTIIVIAVLIVMSLLTIFKFYDNKEELEPEFNFLKNYKDNEYMPIYIKEEDMAKIYYNNFRYYLTNYKTEAYYLLNKNYREKRFSNIDAFIKYISTSEFDTKLQSYRIEHKNDKTYFYVNLNSETTFVFATKGVMQYEVFMDIYTTEII